MNEKQDIAHFKIEQKETIMPRDQTDLLKLIYLFEHEEDLWKVSAEIYNNKRNAALHRITEGLNSALI
jgi:hypothetical protein